MAKTAAEVAGEVGPGDPRKPGVQLEEPPYRAGGAVRPEAGSGKAARPLAGAREEAQGGGQCEAGVDRRAVRRLCELDESIRAEPGGIIAQSKTALAELGRWGLTGEKVRPGVSLEEFAHRAGLLA